MKHLLCALTALWVTSAIPAVAQTTFFYECDLTGTENTFGWITPKLALVSTEEGKVKVIDAVILGINEEPIDGTFLRNNTRRMIVKWRLKNAPTKSGAGYRTFDYRASLNKTTLKVEVTAGNSNVEQLLRSEGTCRLRQN
ncbi:MAG: hypothetical protein ABJL67_23850 [Sulfitobacter sp.]